jgi:hypothetical protein
MKNQIKSVLASIDGRHSGHRDTAYRPKRPFAWYRLALLSGLFALVLSGCFSGRLLSVKEQMCEYGDYVHVDFGSQVSVKLTEPVLLESDIYMLMGASPTTRTETADRVLAGFVFEQLQGGTGAKTIPTGGEIRLDLTFIQSRGELRLAHFEMGEIPIDLLAGRIPDQAEMEAMASQACELSINPFSRSVSMDIDSSMLEDLPGRQAVIDWFGSPIEILDDGNTIAYEYRFKGADTDRPSGRIRASFDDSGEKPLLVEASFAHYLASVDLIEGKMQMEFVLNGASK